MLYHYLIRRILMFIPMLIALSIVIFGLAHAAPGDPFTGKILDPDVDPKIFDEQRKELGLDKPVPVQYLNWVGSFLKGEFGESITFKGRSVKSLIVERFGNTVRLGIVALFITLVVSIPIGLYSARKPYSVLDYGATAFGFMGLAKIGRAH